MAGERVMMRYLKPPPSIVAAYPMRIVSETEDRLVVWLAGGTPCRHWASADGGDPRDVPLASRFAGLTSRPGVWWGHGVLRVVPWERNYQVVHFWDDDGAFRCWYVNFESPKVGTRERFDATDWELDLVIRPDGSHEWKDADEAEAAVAAGSLDRRDLDAARVEGEAILAEFDRWLIDIGDWRSWRPPADWTIPELPLDWAARPAVPGATVSRPRPAG